MDEMLQLIDAKMVSGQTVQFEGVRNIVYNHVRDIPDILSRPVSEQITTTPLAQQIPARSEIPPPPEIEDVDESVLQDMSSGEVEQVEEPTVPTIVRTSEEERAASHLIVKVYKKYQKRTRETGHKGARKSALHRLFTACMAIAPSLSISTRYRCMLLGPLPHVLYCLETLYSNALTYKNAMKQIFRDQATSPSKLEEVDRQLKNAACVSNLFLSLNCIDSPAIERL